MPGALVINADLIDWPGVDRDRAVAAAWHLQRAVQRRIFAERSPDRPWQISRGAALASAREHLRIAHGYLGAVGYEHGVRV